MASKRVLVVLLPALAGLLAVTAACSSKSNDGGTSGNSNTGTKGGSIPGCPTVATMKTELGMDLVAGDVQDLTNVKVCHYTPAPGAKGNAIVRFQGDSSATAFAAAKQIFKNSGQTATDEPGVGDEAYSSSLSALNITTNTIVARKGSLEVLITCQAPLDKEKAFANKLLG